MSGWSQRSVAIMAPRRAPVERMVPHMASHTCMNETGPEAMLPTPLGPHALRSQGREVAADAAALLHGDGRLLQGREDAGDRVLDRPHDEAVEEGDIALGADAGLDAPARQEPEILKDAQEALGPKGSGVLGLHGGECSRHATPGLGDRAFFATAVTMAILGAPDVMGDVCSRHVRWSKASASAKVRCVVAT